MYYNVICKISFKQYVNCVLLNLNKLMYIKIYLIQFSQKQYILYYTGSMYFLNLNYILYH